MNIPPIIMSTGRAIGAGLPAYIIAEIGSNHDGDLQRAKQLIKLAKEGGADAAKFQSFQVEKLINFKSKKNGKWETDPAWETLKRLSMPVEWHYELFKEAKDVGIDFLSTPFDLERLKLLSDLDVAAIKIASGDLTYHELLLAAAKTEKTIILSTGHALLGEVESALTILWEGGCKNIILLHCASLYPASYDDANIPAMVSMRNGFKVQVGYSDHTPGFAVPLGAVAWGASVIEKHLTDDKTRSGPDHAFALDTQEFSMMVREIRHLETALAGKIKTYRPAEKEERVMARRAIYAKQDIPKDTLLTRDMLNVVRHAYNEGIAANHLNSILEKIAVKPIGANEIISWDMIG